MEVLYERCAGLDIHKQTVVACGLTSTGKGKTRQEVETFGTMTRDLEHLARWLAERGVEQVALESTGVYWWPVYNILEEAELPVILVNPQRTHVRPGHKTDRGDAAWLADLLRHGLVQASFIPPAAIRALRELTRYRANLVRARGKEVQHLLKTLEAANIKLDAVASDVVGARGWQMLAALAAGEDDPTTLAQMAKARLRTQLEALEQACIGRVKPHHRVLIQASLDHLRFLERAIEQLDLEVARRGPLLGPSARPGRGARDWAGGRRGHRGRDRRGHGRLSHGRAPDQLGRGLSWAQAERRQATVQCHHQGQRLAAPHLGRGSLGSHPRAGQQLSCPLLPAQTSPGRQARPGGHHAPAAQGDLP
jgi:transposase